MKRIYATETTLAEAKAAAEAATAPSMELDLLVAKALGQAPDTAQPDSQDPEGLGVEWTTPGFEAGMAEARKEPDRDARRAARNRVWDRGEAQGIAHPVSHSPNDALQLLPEFGENGDDWCVSITRMPPRRGGWRVRAERESCGSAYEAESGPEDPNGALAILRVALAARVDVKAAREGAEAY